ncbi:hypothetical protein U1Q18_006595, partial [Sarracenia purpurea var. burkii]
TTKKPGFPPKKLVWRHDFSDFIGLSLNVASPFPEQLKSQNKQRTEWNLPRCPSPNPPLPGQENLENSEPAYFVGRALAPFKKFYYSSEEMFKSDFVTSLYMINDRNMGLVGPWHALILFQVRKFARSLRCFFDFWNSKSESPSVQSHTITKGKGATKEQRCCKCKQSRCVKL